MKKMLCKILFLMFPFFESYIKNKKIKKDLDNDSFTPNVSYMIEKMKYNDETFKEKYKDSLSRKDKLEDKAKTNVIGITIAVSLISGSYTFLNNIYSKYNSTVVQWSSFILLFLIIIYLLVAGIQSIRVLCDLNLASVPKTEALLNKGNTLNEDYENCTKYNNYYNMMRNNVICSSYYSIRNALIGLLILLIIISVPLSLNKNESHLVSKGNGYVFFFDEKTLDYIGDENNKINVEQLIAEKAEISKSNAEIISFVSDKDKLFIKFEKDNFDIYVKIIEPIT